MGQPVDNFVYKIGGAKGPLVNLKCQRPLQKNYTARVLFNHLTM